MSLVESVIKVHVHSSNLKYLNIKTNKEVGILCILWVLTNFLFKIRFSLVSFFCVFTNLFLHRKDEDG